jgi:siderophore synthetase component
MNWKKIQQAWEAGNKQIAVRLLESMIYEMRLKQRTLVDFNGGEIHGEEKEEKESVELRGTD